MSILRIENEKSILTIDTQKSVILGLEANGKELFAGNTYPLFVISSYNQNCENSKVASTEFTLDGMERRDGEYVFTYSYKDEYVVKTTIIADGEAFRFRIGVKNNTEKVIEWVEYPGVSLMDTLDGSKKTKMLWMFNEGVLVSYTKDKMWPYEEPTPSRGVPGTFPNAVQSQFMACLYQGGGLYMGCHDTNKGVKQIDFYHKDERIKMQLRFYTGAEFGGDFELDFDVVFQPFVGEWQDACDIYRAWYDSVTDLKKIPENEQLPGWYFESPLVVALPIRGSHDTADMQPSKLYPYDNLLEEVKRIAEKTKSKLMVLLMHWEGTAPWAPPYVWPPYGGVEDFKEFADKLHAMGHYLGLYCSGMAWTQQSALLASYNKEQEFEEQNLHTQMCVLPTQELKETVTPQFRGYEFCPTSPYLKDIFKREVANMFEAGVDYIQLMDQNLGGGSYYCYSKSHGHSPVPGSWQVNAVNELLEASHQGKCLFGCESAAAEAFIGNLLFSDNRWVWAELVGDAVPAYAYVYHSRVNNFMGNQCCCPIEYAEDDFRYRTAYSFLAGDMLTIVIDEDGEIMHHWGAARDVVSNPDRDKSLAFIQECNSWRRAAKEYLCYGDMQKPIFYECEKTRTYTVERRQKFKKEVPMVAANAFSYGDKKATFFANFTDEEVEICVPCVVGERFFASSSDFADGKATERSGEKILVPALSVVMIERKIMDE